MYVLVGALLLATPVVETGIENTILHGVAIGRVHTELRPGKLSDLTKDDLADLIRKRLDQAGLQLTEGAPAVLWVETILIREQPGTCFATVHGRLLEDAQLDRNGHTVRASSWEGGSLVSASTDECSSHVRRAVEIVARQFLDMYEAMNPNP